MPKDEGKTTTDISSVDTIATVENASLTPAAVNNDVLKPVETTQQGSILANIKDFTVSTVTNPSVLFATGQFFLFSSTAATLPVLDLATASIAMPLAAVNLGVSFGLSAYANRSKLPEDIKNKFRKARDVVNTTLDKSAFRHTATFISNNTPDFIKNNIPKLDPNNPNTALTVNGASLSVLMAPLMLASGDFFRAGFAIFTGLSNISKPAELENKGIHAVGYFKDGKVFSAETKKKMLSGEMLRAPGMISLALASSSTVILGVAVLGEVVALTALFAPKEVVDAFSEKIHNVGQKFNLLKEKPKRDAIINAGFAFSSGVSAILAFSSGAIGTGFGGLSITGGNIKLIELSQKKEDAPKPPTAP